MSFQYSTYSETSGSTSIETNGAGGYNTWGKISASCSTSGSTLYYTLTVNTSNYPYMRVIFWVDGIGNVYDSGYVKTNSKAFPRGNGTTYSSSVNLGSSTSNPTVAVGIGVSTSSITWGSNATFYRTKYNWYWNDINAWNPGETSQHGAKFDVYYSYQNTTYSNQTNEPGPLYGPLNSWMRIFNVRPLDNTQEVYSISGYDGREFNFSSDSKDGLPCYTDGDGYDSWWQYNDNGTGAINIYTRYKVSTLKINPNGGDINGNASEQTLSPNIQYNNSNWCILPVPTRTGYKFLGWFTASSGGIQTHDANGKWIIRSGYWEANGIFKGISNVTLYAQWEIQNVCYVKQDNTWKLSTVYVRDNNEWKPAIMYIKKDGSWVQSGP